MLLLALLLQASTSRGLPAELKAALAARQFLNAQITWESHTRTAGAESTTWGIATYVGDQIAYETHYPDTPPGSGLVDHAIIRGLYWQGALFENDADPLSARLLEDPRMGSGINMDYRVLGMHLQSQTDPSFNPFEPTGDETPEFSVREQDGLVVVTALERTPLKTRERRWSIDPQRG